MLLERLQAQVVASAQGKPLLVWLLPPRCLSAGTASVSLWRKHARGCQEKGRTRAGGWQGGGPGRKAGEAAAAAVTYPQVLGHSDSAAPARLRPACLQWGPGSSRCPPMWRGLGPGKTCFSPSFLEGGSRGPGNSPEILGVWTARSLPVHPGRCAPSAGSPEPPRAPSQPGKELLAGPAFRSWSPCLERDQREHRAPCK